MTSSKPTGASRRKKKGNDGTGAAAQGPRVACDDSERCADQSKAGDDGLRARDEWRQADRAEPGERQVTRADQKAVFQELDPLQRILTPQPRQPAPFTEGDRSRAANADLVPRLELNDPDPAKLKEGKRAAELEGEHTSLASESSVVPAKPSSEVDYLAEVKQALSEERYKNAAAKQRIRSLEASIRLGLYETIELKSRTARAEDKSAEHVAQLKVLERAIDLTEAQLNAVLASPSWRLTAPWRAYKRGLSGLSRAVRGQWENPLFDRAWYVTQYPDIKTGEVDPFTHYLSYGVHEGRNPNPLFDTKWYLNKNYDVASTGINPLVHFYQYGAVEGRDPHPVFSMAWHFDRISRGVEPDTNPMFTFIASLRKVAR
jgi:hypothetical protein